MQQTETFQNTLSPCNPYRRQEDTWVSPGGSCWRRPFGKACLTGGCWETCTRSTKGPELWGQGNHGRWSLFQCPLPCQPKEIAWRWCMNASLHQHITTNTTAIYCEGKRTFRLLFVFNNKMMHFNIESCHLGQLFFSVLCLGR